MILGYRQSTALALLLLWNLTACDNPGSGSTVDSLGDASPTSFEAATGHEGHDHGPGEPCPEETAPTIARDWAILPEYFGAVPGIEFQIHEPTEQELQVGVAILGQEEATEFSNLIESCQSQTGTIQAGKQYVVLGVYRFASIANADRFLELSQKASALKDDQIQDDGKIQVLATTTKDLPLHLGKGLDFHKTVQVGEEHLPVRSTLVAQDLDLVEVTLANISLSDENLYKLIETVFEKQKAL